MNNNLFLKIFLQYKNDEIYFVLIFYNSKIILGNEDVNKIAFILECMGRDKLSNINQPLSF